MIRRSTFLKSLGAALVLALPMQSEAFFFGFHFGGWGGWNPYYYGWGYPGYWGYSGWGYPYAYSYSYYRPFHYFAYPYPVYPRVALAPAESPRTQEK
jgi:hypothetical protein